MEVWTELEAEVLATALQVRKDTVVGIDCETEGIDPKVDPAAGPKGRIVCWTLSWDDLDAFVWATPDTWRVLAPVLATLPVVGHNIFGFDAHMFRKAGAPLGNIVADTLRHHRLINPTEGASHGLKALMHWWLKQEPVGSFEELFTRLKCLEEVPEGTIKSVKRKVGEDQKVPTLLGGAHSRVGSITEFIPLSSIPSDYPELLPILIKYAKLDSRATLQLYHLFRKELQEMPWPVPLQDMNTTRVSGTGRAP